MTFLNHTHAILPLLILCTFILSISVRQLLCILMMIDPRMGSKRLISAKQVVLVEEFNIEIPNTTSFRITGLFLFDLVLFFSCQVNSEVLLVQKTIY